MPGSLIDPNRKNNQTIRISALFKQLLLRNFVLNKGMKTVKTGRFLSV